MKKILLSASLLFAVNIQANDIDSEGKSIFIKKCVSRHSIEIPKDTSTMLAPPARGLKHHMKEAFNKNEDIVKHIQSFVINPTKETAKCGSIKRFGLMPSQKGLVTKKELNKISHWMLELNMTKSEHTKAFGKMP